MFTPVRLCDDMNILEQYSYSDAINATNIAQRNCLVE